MFHFKIGNEYFEGALDRFAQLMIAPLMTKESISKEILTIDSEFQNQINDDDSRLAQLLASTIKSGHPASQFPWGNGQSLNVDIDELHAAVHEFHERYYNSDRIFLCVQSTMSSSVVRPLIQQQFAALKPEDELYDELDNVSDDLFESVFESKFHEKMYFVRSTSKSRKLLLTFPIPACEHRGKYHFLEYITYLINNESKHGLIDHLKIRSLVTSLHARIGLRDFEDNSQFLLFTIEVDLTKRGLDELDRVMDNISCFLLNLKMTPASQHQLIYESFRRVTNSLLVRKLQLNSEENVQELAANMCYIDNDEEIVLGRDKCGDYDERLVAKLLDRLNELKFNLTVLSDNQSKYFQSEKWFGTEYNEIGESSSLLLCLEFVKWKTSPLCLTLLSPFSNFIFNLSHTHFLSLFPPPTHPSQQISQESTPRCGMSDGSEVTLCCQVKIFMSAATLPSSTS